MIRTILNFVVFFIGLIIIGWIAIGYAGNNPLALTVALLIGLVYLIGALEMLRYRQATATLSSAVHHTATPQLDLETWLSPLHISLRNAVRLRIVGHRTALPGPTLTPYLVGLLVLLGMFGTFLGMVATLRGTGLALESASDLQAIRASLAAPVKGLGFAFGTSIAGVAASAMLGLISALCRRERLLVTQHLDTLIATTLRDHSQVQRQEATFHLLQRQADALPSILERMQAMMAGMAEQHQVLNQALLNSQAQFQDKTQTAYAQLATTIEATLTQSATESGRAAGAALQPAVETTLSSLTRETSIWRTALIQGIQTQLAGLSERIEAINNHASHAWNQAITQQQQANETLNSQLQTVLMRYADTFETRTTQLIDALGLRMQTTTRELATAAHQAAAAWTTAATQQTDANTALTTQLEAALHGHLTTFDDRAMQLADTIGVRMSDATQHLAAATAQAAHAWEYALVQQQSAHTNLHQQLQETLHAHAERVDQHASILIDRIGQRLDANANTLAESWRTAAAHNHAAQQQLAHTHQQALQTASTAFEQHAQTLLEALGNTHQRLHMQLGAADEARLAAWSTRIEMLTNTLDEQWRTTREQAAADHQSICTTLAQTTREINAETRAQATATLAEISQLVQAAAEAPRAAANVVTELRQKLADSMVHDNAILEERSRLLTTLDTLLNAVNVSSTEQRVAVDALVATSAELLDRVSRQFSSTVTTEAEKLGDVAAQIQAGAVEVASLGAAFNAGTTLYADANDKLVAHLKRIETALDKSVARGDEQLAYYIAQAREVIDLSMLAQKQIIEGLQQLSTERDRAETP